MFEHLFAVVSASVAQNSPSAMLVLCLVAALTEAGMPFPLVQETAFFYTVYSMGPLSFNMLLLIAVLMLGGVIGGSAVWGVSRLFGGRLIDWLSRRWPAFGKNVRLLVNRLERRAILAVAIARLTPGLLTVTSVAAGSIRVRYVDFVLGICLAAVATDVVMLGLGLLARGAVQALNIESYSWVTVVGPPLLMMLATAIYTLWQRHRRHAGLEANQ
jgi:membrane protein DedA with SNARE-associated domain